jgi:hypothetical protein
VSVAEEKLWSYVGLAIAGAALWQWWKKGSVLETVREAEAAATYEGDLSQAAPGVGGAEQAFGAVSRALGFESPPHVGVREDRPADESKGPFLGTPRNALRVAGAMTQPVNGAHLDLTWGTGTIEAFASIENQASERRLGQVRARIIERNGSTQREAYVDGPFVDLAPGEFKEITMRVPLPFSGFWLDPDSSQVSLLFAGHTLDTAVFTRD